MFNKLKQWLQFRKSYHDLKMSRQAELTISSNQPLGDEPIRLSIYNASGGFVIETRTYDSKKDQSKTNLYIVTDTEKMGEELSKIITLTSLTR